MRTKLTILAILSILGAAAYFLINEGQRVSYNTGYEPDQPINFSHKIHAGDNQVACVYCHFAAEKGRHAGIPPVELCMNCHVKIKFDAPEIKKIAANLKEGKGIEWVKVHHYPDFAYFNHSQHVRLGKVSCQECHGPVETMTRMRQENTLNMGWCLDCHRQKGIAQPTDHKNAGAADCAKCHY